MGGALALVCAFHYPLYLSSFTPKLFLCGLLGLYCFLLFPHGLGHWLGRSPYPSSPLSFCSCNFSSCYAYRPASCHWPIGLFTFFLGFRNPFTFFLPLVVHMGLLAVILVLLAHWAFYLFSWAWPIYFTFTSCCSHEPASSHSYHVGPLGSLPLFLGFHNSFTLLLPLVMHKGLLAVILAMLAHRDFYLFSWASTTHLLYSYIFYSLSLSSFLVVRLFLPLDLLSKMGINTEKSSPKNSNSMVMCWRFQWID